MAEFLFYKPLKSLCLTALLPNMGYFIWPQRISVVSSRIPPDYFAPGRNPEVREQSEMQPVLACISLETGVVE